MFCRSEDMPRGSSSIIAQSLRTLQQNGPKLVCSKKIQTTINACLLLISYHCGKKKFCHDENYATPEDNYSYWNSMTGINSSIDRLVLRQNVEINSNWCFSYDVFSGMKLSTTWNRNAIVQSPRKMSEFRDVSNTSDIWFLMVYRMIINAILHSFIICNDLWCQLPFFLTEALFSVRCLRCVVVARM